MNQTATKPVETQPSAAAAQRASLLTIMAAKYHMDPQTFASTVRKTAMPSNATNEEFAAFMMVAKEYNLNPILKEIHAFPKKGGGIQPIVSIDGWVSLINQHPMCDGFDFKWHHDEKGEPISCECTMYRKDRSHPVVVEEFLSEAIRGTDPWKMKHRMLRHRALIQAARYAFGFSGIMTEEEFEPMKDITPRPARPTMADFAVTEESRREEAKLDAELQDHATGETNADPTHDPDTGEIVEQDATDTFGPADAMARGREDFDKGKALRAVPPEWRDNPACQPLAEAWQEGWREREAEVAATKKK